MVGNDKKLSVRLHGKEVGILYEHRGKMRFKYDQGALTPLSLSLPLTDTIYPEKECRAFFGGLLPESDQTRKILARNYKISENNDFAFLAAIGHDCAGAVSFHQTNEPEQEQCYTEQKGNFLNEHDLEQHIRELPQKPYLGQRLSLAGAQEKTPISYHNGRYAIPADGCPSTHILKPAISRFKESIENEYICLLAAQQCGIPVPEIKMDKAGQTPFFLIKRYDREESSNLIQRLHQEDFAQALGVCSEKKYTISVKDCLKIIQQTATPALTKKQFINRVVFNYFIGNCDAHGKNFSLLYNTPTPNLAPAYDILSTMVYPDLESKMAMKIGREADPLKLSLKDWVIFSDDIEVKPSLVIEELTRQMNTLPDLLEIIVQQTDSEIGHEIQNVVRNNCVRCRHYL